MNKYMFVGVGLLVVIVGVSTWCFFSYKIADQSNFKNEIVEIPCDYPNVVIPDDAKPVVLDSQYLKNNQYVYLNSVDEAHIIPSAEPATFRVLSDIDEFGMDAHHVYYVGCELLNAQPATFKHLPNGTYGTDGIHVYWRWKMLSYVDPLKFVSLPRGYGKDNKVVYWENKKVQGADPLTFQSFEDKVSCNGSCTITAQDKNHTYMLNEIVQ